MSSPGQRRIDEIGDESRRRILDAAEELFAERGFDRTSFVDIAERSGISRGSIPWHFKNKDGLVIAVVERAIARVMSPERYRSVPTLPKLFDDSASMLREGNSALMFMVLTEGVSSKGTIHAQYQEYQSRRIQGFQNWLRAQRPDGADPEAASKREHSFAVALNGVLIGIHLQSLIDPAGFDLDEVLRTVATLLERHLADIWSP